MSGDAETLADEFAPLTALADEWAATVGAMSHWFAAQVLYDTIDLARSLRAAQPTEGES